MADDVELADIEVGEVPRAAGGLAALTATTRHLVRDGAVRRGAKALLAMNQPDGFDCPGCAWPEPAAAVRHRLEFCENGAKAIAEEATTLRATPEVFAAASIDDLRGLSDFELGQLGRITEPMVLDGRHYRRIDWDGAIRMLADVLHATGPTASAFYTSGRTSNEAAFLYQLVGRMFGTNNFPDCSNMCHESSGIALTDVIGAGKGTVSLGDFDVCDLVLVIGQNPGTNHPRMLSTLREAAKRGATIIAVNRPRRARPRAAARAARRGRCCPSTRPAGPSAPRARRGGVRRPSRRRGPRGRPPRRPPTPRPAGRGRAWARGCPRGGGAGSPWGQSTGAGQRGAGGYLRRMSSDQSTTDDMVAESALQLWSAAQTDFDPFEVDSSEWPETAVPVRDADIAVDTRLEVDDVRAALERLDGVAVVVGREAGTLSVLRVVPQDTPL
jgi:hypothetical protein